MYPSVTLTRSFFTTWVGTPRGFLWTRNCVVTFGLAIAGFPLDSQLRGYLWTRNCVATFWFYIPGSIFLVLYSWLCIPGFQISHFRFQIPEFRLQISDVRFQIPDCRFQISDSSFQIPDFRFHISDSRFQISGFGFQISDFKFAQNLVNIVVFACFSQKSL